MKKIGREVLFLGTGEGNPRNGEGTFIRLKNGQIMFAYTEYYGSDWADHAIAHLCACTSCDEGESWSEPRVIVEKDEKAENIMSPSLIRLNNGDLGIIFLRKEKMPDNGVTCMPAIARSTDEGMTFSEPKVCDIPLGYYCAINDGAVRLKNGRLLVPLSYHGIRYDAFGTCTLDLSNKKSADIRIAYSDDDGISWALDENVIESPFCDSTGFAEPGIYEHEDGGLWMWFRTGYGFQYHASSRDGGTTWTKAEPNFRFTSPDSPMRVRRVGKYTAAVFNPKPFSCVGSDFEVWGSPKRTPLVCAVCEDDAHSFAETHRTGVNGTLKDFVSNCYLVEDDPENSFCYPALCEVDGGFLLAYYHSAGTKVCLNSTKITKIMFDELN